MSGVTKKEKERRTAKSRGADFDDILFGLLDKEPEKLEEVLIIMAQERPKDFSNLLIARLPKVSTVDQDLQKNALALTEMMADLPDIEDIAGHLHRTKIKLGKAETLLQVEKETHAITKQKLTKARNELKELKS